MATHKRRARGQGTVFVRKDGRVIARLNAGRDENGKPIPVEKVFGKPDTPKDLKLIKEAAQNWLNEQLVLYSKGVNIIPSKITFGKLSAEFLLLKKALKRSPTTLDKYASIVKNHLAEWDDLRPSEAAEKAQALMMRISLARKPATAHEVWQIARQIFEMALDRDLIRRIPKVQLPTIESRVPDLYTPDQLRDLVAVANKSNYAPVLWLEIGSGARIGELLALTHKDLGKDYIVINKGLIRDGGKVALKPSPKTEAGDRKIYVPDFIMDAINALPHHKKSNLVFPSETGTYISPWNFGRQWRAWCEALDKSYEKRQAKEPDFEYTPITGARFHDLRHQFVSMMHSLGIGMKVSQTQAGHADIKTHVKRYMHPKEEELKDAATRVGTELQSIIGGKGALKVSKRKKKAPKR